MTPLDRPLRREVTIDGEAYTLVIDPDGLSLTRKGHRRGFQVSWREVVSGNAALAVALQASVEDL